MSKTNCIETRDLTHAFAPQSPGAGPHSNVLHHLNIHAPQGSIYGFLGPNGAGKTTTLRLLLGLLRKQAGEISIFDKSFDNDRIAILRQIGSLIESPSLYSHLTAAENLNVWQRLYQCPKERIGQALELVGLSNTAQKRVSQFSLGMKQRLSIAVSLLHAPQLLILDEPTNGLDPQGIIDIREMLKRLNHEHGTTVLISSHLLAEIERLVTHIGIIHQGRMLFEGPLAELQARQTADAMIQLDVSDVPRATQIIQSLSLEPSVIGGVIRLPATDKATIGRINAALVGAGVEVYQIQRTQSDLESIFIGMVGAN